MEYLCKCGKLNAFCIGDAIWRIMIDTVKSQSGHKNKKKNAKLKKTTHTLTSRWKVIEVTEKQPWSELMQCFVVHFLVLLSQFVNNEDHDQTCAWVYLELWHSWLQLILIYFVVNHQTCRFTFWRFVYREELRRLLIRIWWIGWRGKMPERLCGPDWRWEVVDACRDANPQIHQAEKANLQGYPVKPPRHQIGTFSVLLGCGKSLGRPLKMAGKRW